MTETDCAPMTAAHSLPRIRFASYPTPVEPLSRLAAALGSSARLLVKRDDAIGFAMGGNKVRKLEVVAAAAIDAGCDTLVTTGSIQSNHCRATAAVAARLGLDCVLIVNGQRRPEATGNLKLMELYGAVIVVVGTRDEREPGVSAAVARLNQDGRRPYVIPLGASIPLGAAAYALAIDELVTQGVTPDVILHASSSGGTQAGLGLGCRLAGLRARVIGVSADEPAEAIGREVARLAEATAALLGTPQDLDAPEVDDAFVGEGYGIPTPASREATTLFARHEGLLLDPTYTAKAGAALIARVRRGEFDGQTVLFWHTGGLPGFFA